MVGLFVCCRFYNAQLKQMTVYAKIIWLCVVESKTYLKLWICMRSTHKCEKIKLKYINKIGINCEYLGLFFK